MFVGHAIDRRVLSTRILCVIVGSAAVIWGLVTLPIFWQESALARIAQSIIRGDPYSREALARAMPGVEATEQTSFCSPTALRSAAIIRVRMAELDVEEKSNLQSNTANSIVQALSCSPADSFLWLALYWLRSGQYGFSPDDLKYLRLSYQLGPDEGWIALKRNALTFAMLQELPTESGTRIDGRSGPSQCNKNRCKLSDFSETGVNEFVGLVRSGLYDEAAAVFIGPAWPHRELILQQLAGLPEQDRHRFSEALRGHSNLVDVSAVAARLSSQPSETAAGGAGGITGKPSSQPLKIP
jgi:hypothetical protein